MKKVAQGIWGGSLSQALPWEFWYPGPHSEKPLTHTQNQEIKTAPVASLGDKKPSSLSRGAGGGGAEIPGTASSQPETDRY